MAHLTAIARNQKPPSPVNARMRNRKLWPMGLIVSIPVIGIALAYAMPPFNEYAIFDRIGSPVTIPAADPDQFLLGEPAPYFRHRRWSLQLPETEADRLVKQFTSPARGWQRAGGSSGFSSVNGHETDHNSTIYMNGETGDELEFAKDIEKSGSTKTIKIAVTLAQEKTSGQWFKRLKRWAQLTFSR